MHFAGCSNGDQCPDRTMASCFSTYFSMVHSERSPPGTMYEVRAHIMVLIFRRRLIMSRASGFGCLGSIDCTQGIRISLILSLKGMCQPPGGMFTGVEA